MSKRIKDIKVVDNSKDKITDMPKIHAPFKRHENSEGEYVVYDEVNEGNGWSDEHPSDNDGRWKPKYVTKGFEKQCDCDTDEVEKGTILDPFAGAGTTCVAARQYNRNYIGIELNEEYAELARNRIKDEIGGVSLDNFVKSEQKTITDSNL